MKKLLMLIGVLMKCGQIGKTESKSKATGDISELITWAMGAAIVVGMFFVGRYLAGNEASMGSAETIFRTLLITSGGVAFIMTLFTAMNQLYMASDIDVLVTLPFTAVQLVSAKLASASAMPAALCFGMVVPGAIGYVTVSSTYGAMFLISMILGALLTTMYAVSTAGIIIIVIMRVFRFVRSRNVISVVAALLMFGGYLVYALFCSNGGTAGTGGAQGLFGALSGMTGSIAVAFPATAFIVKAAMGNFISILIALAIAVASLAILIVVARFFYFDAALGMTDANGKRGEIDQKDMGKLTRRSSISSTLFKREIVNILRTPSLLTKGYLQSIVLPFVMFVPIVLSVVNQLQEQGVPVSIDGLRSVTQDIPGLMLLAIGTLLGMFLSSMAVAMSCLPRFPLSREGKDFDILVTMPISIPQLITLKIRAAMCFTGISGFVAPALIFIFLGIVGVLPIWVALCSIITVLAWFYGSVEFCASFDLRSPNLNWDNDSVVTKGNAQGLILFVVALALLIGSIFVWLKVAETNSDALSNLVCIVAALIPVGFAIFNDITVRHLAKKLAR